MVHDNPVHEVPPTLALASPKEYRIYPEGEGLLWKIWGATWGGWLWHWRLPPQRLRCPLTRFRETPQPRLRFLFARGISPVS